VGAPALVAIAMGAVTGTVGGMIRVTLGHVPSVLLRHEIYVTASVLGACTYVGLNGVGLDRLAAMIGGFLVTLGVRGLAIKLGAYTTAKHGVVGLTKNSAAEYGH
jgi:uncharacterized membrane protein YeiH